MDKHYIQQGYKLYPKVISADWLKNLTPTIQKFHERWLKENQAWYEERAINSASLTKPGLMTESERQILFDFIGSHAVMNLVNNIFQGPACFLNTQLFFDPFNPQQNNYWHRDPQYHMSEDEQKLAFTKDIHQLAEVIHFRIPLTQDPGIELIPGTHNRWDTKEELSVRLEKSGRHNHEDLPDTHTQPLTPGDVFVFSANMIHRGLYGGNRMALDLIFFEPNKGVEEFVEKSCLPNTQQLSLLDNPSAFEPLVSSAHV